MPAADLEKRFSGSLPEIKHMGMMLLDPIWAEHMHTSNCCEIMHIISGTVELVMKDGSFEAGPGETLLVPTGTLHRDGFDLDKGLEVFYCFFTWQKEKDFFARVDNTVLLAMSAVRKRELSMTFDQLRSDLSGISEADKLVARARVLTILLLMIRETVPGGVERDSRSHGRRQELMRQAKAYLEKHYTRGITLDDIASALNVSSYYLSHVFSEESEFSLFSFLTSLRMAKARTLLLNGKLNVSEVANAVGYESANYFSKVFNKHCGCSPRDYASSAKTAQKSTTQKISDE